MPTVEPVFDDGERGALDGGDGGVVIGVDRVVRLSGFDETDADQRSQDDENREKHDRVIVRFFMAKDLFGFFVLLYQILGDLQWGFRGIGPYKCCGGVKQKGSASIWKRSILWVNP